MSRISRLSDLPRHCRARIISFAGSADIHARLNTMGLSAGMVVEVLSGSASANYLVSTGNTRIGMEPVLAQAITVQIL